jgi:hypothetical protein
VLPLLEPTGAEQAYLAPGIAGGGSLLLFTWGALTVRTNVDHPAGASLVYAMDADSNAAWLTGYAGGAGARSALRHVLRGATPGPVSPAPVWLKRAFNERNIIPAPRVVSTPPTAVVLSDSTVGDQRRARLRISPGRGGRLISVTVESGTVLSAAVDEKPIATERYRSKPRRWSLSYVAPSDSGFTLELRLPAASGVTLGILSEAGGLPPLPQMRLPPPPAGIVPVQSGAMTWVYYRMHL